MRGRVLAVAWYRFRSTFARSWGGYLSLVLLIGLAGGIGLGSLAAARRTQSSFATFLQSTNPTDLQLTEVYGPNLTSDLARLRGVSAVGAADYNLTVFPLAPNGTPVISKSALLGETEPIGSVNGEYFDLDKVTVTAGRMANPERLNEFVATVEEERLDHLRVGESIRLAFYTSEEGNSPDFGSRE